ncbi:hypothetical protein WOLCODRAFT_167044 [Wolfiporia cocos MD-104 SS10]|uniref:Uncharacterized protein n=1 Tax=Wolfiporia cocos (strain MD-104) TaxID=742152 RepID=A0A2H3J315_WOLCO|nr:hypothetical protein WOLCODRAFT_167044 [Wolfiporia cocos MD-104 SS10]
MRFYIVPAVVFAAASVLSRPLLKRDVNANLVPQFGIIAGVKDGNTGSCQGVDGTNGQPILIPCQCPPDRDTFLDSLNANVAADHAIHNPSVAVSFPTDSSTASQLTRLNAALVTLQNINGSGVGCPAAATTWLALEKQIQAGGSSASAPASSATAAATATATATSASASATGSVVATSVSDASSTAFGSASTNIPASGATDPSAASSNTDHHKAHQPISSSVSDSLATTAVDVVSMSTDVACATVTADDTATADAATAAGASATIGVTATDATESTNATAAGAGSTASGRRTKTHQATSTGVEATTGVAVSSSIAPSGVVSSSAAAASSTASATASNVTMNTNLVPQFGVEAGVNPDGTGNCDGVNGTNGKPVLIPCACPPNRQDFIDELSANVAAGHVLHNPSVSLTFPLDNSTSSQLARLNAAAVTLQNFNGSGVGCPVAATTFSAQGKAIQAESST